MVTAQTPREEREQGEDSKKAEIIQRGKKKKQVRVDMQSKLTKNYKADVTPVLCTFINDDFT